MDLQGRVTVLRSKEGHIMLSPLVGSILSMPGESVRKWKKAVQVSGNAAVIFLISGPLRAIVNYLNKSLLKGEFASWPTGIDIDLLYLQTFSHMVELGDQGVKKVCLLVEIKLKE